MKSVFSAGTGTGNGLLNKMAHSLKATHRAALAQLDALFASLQQRAFAGEL